MSKNEKSKKKSKQRGIELLILLIIGLIVGGGYYLLNNGNDLKDNNTIPSTTKSVKKINIVDLDSKIRPYAIMINNLGTARPLQSGLQDAYMIYEIVVEGGLTRYLALFMDTETTRIGSIRSARHYFLDYVLESDAIYVHNGQSPQASSDFKALGIDRIEVDNSKTGWRDKTLNVASEHTLFTSIEKLANGIGSKRTERNKNLVLDYSIEPIDLSKINGSKVANNISVTYSSSVTSSYEYDAELKVYKRFVNDKEHSDYVTKKQYTFKNIITYEVTNSNIAGDTSGRQNLANIGSGDGWYITNGYAVPITWSKADRSSRTIYKYLDGTEIKVNDGNTFIQIQPKNKKLSIS